MGPIKGPGQSSKARLSFEEPESVFYDPESLTIADPDHSEDEFRFVDIGISNQNRVLVVVYTERKDRIRIISVSKATKNERKQHEQSR